MSLPSFKVSQAFGEGAVLFQYQQRPIIMADTVVMPSMHCVACLPYHFSLLLSFTDSHGRKWQWVCNHHCQVPARLPVCGKRWSDVAVSLDTVKAINVRLYMMVALTELHAFMLLSLTLTLFRGYNGVVNSWILRVAGRFLSDEGQNIFDCC